MKNDTTIGCAVLTYQAKQYLPQCLLPLQSSSLRPKILVVDSSSTDGTADAARRLGVDTHTIPKSEFNHGLTRELARKRLGTDIVCLLTQDAYLETPNALAALIAPIVNKQASVAYARQIPHMGANFFEGFARAYNYPAQGHIRSIDDIDTYGIFTFFCSNSCAAYSNASLDEIGGFDEVLLGEDTVAAAKLLRKGHKIAYVADALVRHSHRYTLWEEFRRNFDTGLARKSYSELLKCEKGDSTRGRDYVKAMMRQLASETPHLIPYALVHILSKWSGYKIGSHAHHAPIWLKRMLSSQKFYWASKS